MRTYRYNKNSMKRYRQALRNNPTIFEARLWERLRKRQVRGMKFRRQHSIDNMVVDFYCPQIKLVIELDGAHHYEPQNKLDDQFRDNYLDEEFGIRVLRFKNAQVQQDMEGVIREIEEIIDEIMLD